MKDDELLRELGHVISERDIAEEKFRLICQSLGMGESHCIQTALKIISNLNAISDAKDDNIIKQQTISGSNDSLH